NAANVRQRQKAGAQFLGGQLVANVGHDRGSFGPQRFGRAGIGREIGQQRQDLPQDAPLANAFSQRSGGAQLLARFGELPELNQRPAGEQAGIGLKGDDI
ncbi:MAG: hypothetical protein KDH90_06025, partial [Anaerolineae bacterium]|nr:hypothetical protein [Anaerolineae bacterium]